MNLEGDKRPTILPPDLFQRYAKLSFWRDLQKSKAYRIVVKSTDVQEIAMPRPMHATEHAS